MFWSEICNILFFCEGDKILADFRICVSVPLTEMLKKHFFVFGCIWLDKIVTFRSSHQRCSTATLFKKRLWHRCFSVNFVKFLRKPFSQNTSGRLLLYVLKKILILHSVEVLSSLNSPLLFVIVFWGEANRSKWNFYLQRY